MNGGVAICIDFADERSHRPRGRFVRARYLRDVEGRNSWTNRAPPGHRVPANKREANIAIGVPGQRPPSWSPQLLADGGHAQIDIVTVTQTFGARPAGRHRRSAWTSHDIEAVREGTKGRRRSFQQGRGGARRTSMAKHVRG